MEVIVTEVGDLCAAYQLMNEPNNPAYRFFPAEHAAIAVSQGASIIRRASPQTCTAINVTVDMIGWFRYLRNILTRSAGSIDIVGLDYYPGTWTLGYQQHWTRVMEIADLIASAPADSIWHGRRLAVMETGFCTNCVMRHESRQAKYFRSIEATAVALRRKLPGNGFLFGIYELCDRDSNAFLDPESHFGVCRSDLTPKGAFASVKNIIETL